MATWYDVDEIVSGVWRVNDGELDNSYIIRGEAATAVIDTGMGVGDLAGLAATLSAAPPVVINTHAHPDHISGNYQFREVWMTATEWRLAQEWHQADAAHNRDEISPLHFIKPRRPFPSTFDPTDYPFDRLVPPVRLLADGDVLDLGGVTLEVLLTPAHTPGGICLLDRARRLLFTGDTLHRGTVWLHLEESLPAAKALAAYERLAGYAEAVDYVLPGHSTAVLPGAFLAETCAVMRRIVAGEMAPQAIHTFAGDGWFYDCGGWGPILKEPLGRGAGA